MNYVLYLEFCVTVHIMHTSNLAYEACFRLLLLTLITAYVV